MNENEFYNLIESLFLFDTRPTDNKIRASIAFLSHRKKCTGEITRDDLFDAVSTYFSQELSRVCYCLDTTPTINIMIKILMELNKKIQ
jgi:hypothetical protein